MTEPANIWIDFMAANRAYAAYDEPPETDTQHSRSHYRLATLPHPDDAARIAALEAALKELLEAYEKPDRLMCCNGHHCGCRGASIRDMAEHYARAALEAPE